MTKDEFFKFRDKADKTYREGTYVVEGTAIEMGLLIRCRNCGHYNWHEETKCENCQITMKPQQIAVLAGNIARDLALDSKTAQVLAVACLHVEWLKTAGGRRVEGYAQELIDAVHERAGIKNE